MGREDKLLTQRLRAGEPGAYKLLYELYAPRVTGYLLRMTVNRAQADDLVQDVFLAAYQGRRLYSERSSLLAWLLGIAVRRYRDSNRAASFDTEEIGETIEALPSAIRLENAAMDKLSLEESLSRIAPLLREALLLVCSQGLTYKEAAELTGAPVGTVKWRVWEASRQVRCLLTAIEDEIDELHQPEPGTVR